MERKDLQSAELQRVWTAAIDAYCERTSPAFWAEPLNAVTNAAFLIAAWAAWRWAEPGARRDPWYAAFVGLVATIGVGSFLFHTFAQRWAGLADVVPILIFMLLFLGVAVRRWLGAPILIAAAVAPLWIFGGAAALRAGADAIGVAPDARVLLGGLVGYGPALLALGGMAALTWRRGPGPILALAAAAFALSLGFRTADEPLCGSWPLGTHFMWHVLNGLVLWLCLTAYGRHGVRAAAA